MGSGNEQQVYDEDVVEAASKITDELLESVVAWIGRDVSAEIAAVLMTLDRAELLHIAVAALTVRHVKAL